MKDAQINEMNNQKIIEENNANTYWSNIGFSISELELGLETLRKAFRNRHLTTEGNLNGIGSIEKALKMININAVNLRVSREKCSLIRQIKTARFIEEEELERMQFNKRRKQNRGK